jgi:hypothetical protein
MKNLFPTIFFLLICSCSQPELWDINDLDWIIGEWISTSGDESMTEHWQKESDTLIVGHGWFISSSDTILTEQLKIAARNNDIIYFASPSGQTTTEFKLTQLNDNEATFENPDHDFPQKIYYKKISEDSLYAKIEGTINRNKKVMDFYWKRIRK